jgi:hypothetical protein
MSCIQSNLYSSAFWSAPDNGCFTNSLDQINFHDGPMQEVHGARTKRTLYGRHPYTCLVVGDDWHTRSILNDNKKYAKLIYNYSKDANNIDSNSSKEVYIT